MTKRTEQKENTRRRVLQVARECVSDRDVREVSMQEIAQRTGVSVGALYVHFENRDALIDAIVSGLQDELVVELRGALLAVERPSVFDAITQLAEVYVRTLGAMRPWVSLYASNTARTTSTEALRSSGRAAPLVQTVNATLAVLGLRLDVDLALLAASVVSLWRAAGISLSSRPPSDAPQIATSLAILTRAVLAGACPELLERDAKPIARTMVQFLK